MINLNYSLPQPGVSAASRGSTAAPAAPAAPTTGIALDGFKLSPDAERRIDDYARRHAEAFGPKAPPSSGPSLPKLDLGWQIDESTRLSLKPSLKKFKVELKVKF